MPRQQPHSVRLQPEDPFDLIRWLARTQSDPRKAVAELVQNAIDAGARSVVVERRRLRGAAALRVWDDGEGVMPRVPREEALRHVATHIGTSHKRNLSLRERHEQVIAGKYGVGLLGFWAIGKHMEIHSRVGGSEVGVLRMTEDDPRAEVGTAPLPLDAADTFTEVVVLEMHEAALRLLTGRKLADYLALELRGVLAASGVALRVHDGLARGVAQRSFEVVPPRFTGQRLALPAELETGEGQPPIRVELYLGGEGAGIQVACAGTLVADDIRELASLGLDEEPWVGCDLEGLVDFAGFVVAPGTRRGVAPDGAALAFVEAMERLRPLVLGELERLHHERQAARGRQVMQELRKALRGLAQRLPYLDLPLVDRGGERAGAPRGASLPAEAEEREEAAELALAGPLASVQIEPASIEVMVGRERRVRAVARDARGSRIRDGVSFAWTSYAPGFELGGEGARPALAVAAGVVPGSETTIRVRATQGDVAVEATARAVAVVARDEEERAGTGIPEPELVDDPGGTWRSRTVGGRWQVNASHEDWVALRADPRASMRYLLALFAKEAVLRSCPVPGVGPLLEQMVAVLAHAETNLIGERR